MSNPFTRGSLTVFPNGAGRGTDNITGLANTKALGLGAVTLVNAGAPAADCVVAPVVIKSGASGVSGSGYCSLYLICSEDGTNWDAEISPSSTSDQSAKVPGARLIQQMAVNTNATQYAFDEFSVWSQIGFIPSQFTIVVWNESGASLDATAANFSTNYAVDSYN